MTPQQAAYRQLQTSMTSIDIYDIAAEGTRGTAGDIYDGVHFV